MCCALAAPVAPLGPARCLPRLLVVAHDSHVAFVPVSPALRSRRNPQADVTRQLAKANIPPHVTQLVWNKLEEQNPSFFYAYNVRLRLLEQVNCFNHLVSQRTHARPSVHRRRMQPQTLTGLLTRGDSLPRWRSN